MSIAERQEFYAYLRQQRSIEMGEAMLCVTRRIGRGLLHLGSRLGTAWRSRDRGGPQD